LTRVCTGRALDRAPPQLEGRTRHDHSRQEARDIGANRAVGSAIVDNAPAQDGVMARHPVVGRDQWNAAREGLLRMEKEHTRVADELARERADLPWVAVDNDYLLDTVDGPRSLADLFDGRSQLVVYHFMFGPAYTAGCPINSSIADALDPLVPHLNAHDVTVLLVSSAPIEKLRAYEERMGWSIPWASSANSDFNRDLGAAFDPEVVQGWVPGAMPPVVDSNAAATGTSLAEYLTESPVFSVFVLEDGTVYQTYRTTGRGLEVVMPYYGILDRVPKGRDEAEGFQLWLRRHDEYEA
jgi:predicted dithiol-disulfide oxidoreductase (DUF899 family)